MKNKGPFACFPVRLSQVRLVYDFLSGQVSLHTYTHTHTHTKDDFFVSGKMTLYALVGISSSEYCRSEFLRGEKIRSAIL